MKVDRPAILVSHFFWKWYFEHHQENLARMNKERNRSNAPWSYPSSSADFWEAFGRCPVCGGARVKTFKPFEFMKGIQISRVYCVCHLVSELERESFGESGFRPFTFDQFKFNIEPADKGPKMRQAIDAVQNWCANPFGWLVFTGGKGSGKTSAMAAIKHELGNLAFYMTMPDFQGQMFNSMNGVGYENLQVMVQHLSGVPILLLDDIGMESEKSSLTYSTLAAIIDRRYTLGRVAPVVVSSNVPDLLHTTNANLGRVADRVFDGELAQVILFNQKSYRTGL